VFVFSGILPICGNDDGVAAVLGHEIAHNVAHHTAEKMSQAYPLLLLDLILSYTFGVPQGLSGTITDLVIARPGGRKQEVYTCTALKDSEI
jgi:Zn-dependent protease with chaperone function